LEQANIKLSSVASHTLGVSGLQMIETIIAGEGNAEPLAILAKDGFDNERLWMDASGHTTAFC
jgi:hypothetical protein